MIGIQYNKQGNITSICGTAKVSEIRRLGLVKASVTGCADK